MNENLYICTTDKKGIMDLSARKYSFIQEIFKVEEDTFEKLEKILKKDKLDKIGVPTEHKDELDKRLEAYRKNPQDLLDWDDVKKNW
ncbi:addiction module protein [Flavobacterium eburneipallidum]|uniref:addiction module protein n=1 Tax=Flavobacterium eburneipallidum TaxID=3003263 RepID=UPI0022AC50BC|nr:addiction module protein [Flavobacterium eburneipallidum]